MKAWPEEPIKNAHIIPDNEKNQDLAAIHSQILPAKNTLKCYQEFSLHIIEITSLNHIREYALNEFVETKTFSVRKPEGHRHIG